MVDDETKLARIQVIMLKIIFQFVFSLLLSSWSIAQKLNITVYNKTGYDLDSVLLDDYYLGEIKKDSAFFISERDEITMQGDVPLHRPFGIIKGKKRPFNLKPCATKSKKKKSGSFAFDIFLYETPNECRLYWKKHE